MYIYRECVWRLYGGIWQDTTIFSYFNLPDARRPVNTNFISKILHNSFVIDITMVMDAAFIAL